MISRRGVLSGVVAATASVDVSGAQNKIISIEDQTKSLAMALQKIHGGKWVYWIDTHNQNVIVSMATGREPL